MLSNEGRQTRALVHFTLHPPTASANLGKRDVSEAVDGEEAHPDTRGLKSTLFNHPEASAVLL